jgi:hypothetical protein|tara:strand:+ start:9303 stop:9518 length:216 start_codon:yes stop_codon:yes gene_type:complete
LPAYSYKDLSAHEKVIARQRPLASAVAIANLLVNAPAFTYSADSHPLRLTPAEINGEADARGVYCVEARAL